MGQVFHNLIENAIQHSKPGQAVEVDGEEFWHGGRLWIDCTIADMGPGFREEDLSRLFEPFFTKRRGGTGLGLSIVQKIVEEHGGKIWANNRPGGGAIMKLRFKTPSPPAAPGTDSVYAPERGHSARGGRDGKEQDPDRRR